MPSRPAIFLDRDGTVIVERDYLRDPALVELEAGVAEGLRQLSALGAPLLIASNQSGIARGYLTLQEAEAVNRRVDQLLAAEGVQITHWSMCPHRPEENCPCRKPATGMALEAARLLDLDLSRSVMIGDKPTDVEMGRAFGGAGILVETGYGSSAVDWARANGHPVFADLRSASGFVAQWLTR